MYVVRVCKIYIDLDIIFYRNGLFRTLWSIVIHSVLNAFILYTYYIIYLNIFKDKPGL